jgi:arsenate reductase (thioredoxin)
MRSRSALLMAALAVPAAGQPAKQAPVVLFVCEHGAAKSVVAAAHFNRIAAEKGLAVRAIARGTDPDAEMNPLAVKGLAADGLPLSGKPQRVTADEVRSARRAVALGCDLSKVAPGAKVEHWDDVPPMGQDYAKSRDVMLGHIRRLLAELEGLPGKR